MFRLLKLSPPHGWRAVWWELGIVTLGVLIALGAQQVVERLSSEGRARHAQTRIHDEIDVNITAELERVALRNCLSSRLADLATGLATGRTRWKPAPLILALGKPKPAVPEMYHMPFRVWVTDAYDEALAQGDLKDSHPETRSNFAQFYDQMNHVANLNEEEVRLAAALAPLAFNPALSGPEKRSLIATIARLDQINREIVLNSRQLFAIYRELGYSATPLEIRDFDRAGWNEIVAGWQSRYGACVDKAVMAELDPGLA